jgi:CheY-like chemotaxis protein
MPDQLNVLLADDDADDRYFFNRALKSLPVLSHLTMVEDGEQLMMHLAKNTSQLPDVLFLDLNMPRKNGMECLKEITSNKLWKDLPVIICSTSMYAEMAYLLYENGAYYYIKKGEVSTLQYALQIILTDIQAAHFYRPSREKFILNMVAH